MGEIGWNQKEERAGTHWESTQNHQKVTDTVSYEQLDKRGYPNLAGPFPLPKTGVRRALYRL